MSVQLHSLITRFMGETAAKLHLVFEAMQLQFLEHHDCDGFVIAATNLKTQLDSALFRRFDAVLTYELPAEDSVRPLIAQRLSLFDTKGIDWAQVANEAVGLSHAEIVRAAEEAARDAVMAERDTIESSDLATALRKRKTR